MGIKFDKDPLAVEQNYYLTKIVNVYIIFDLDDWPRNTLRNLTTKTACIVEKTSIVKDTNKIWNSI